MRDRARQFDSDRLRRQFVATLAGLRAELSFKIIGYVLMPEHFHALIRPLPNRPKQGSADPALRGPRLVLE